MDNMTKSKINLKDEKNIGSIPLQKKPILTPHEEIFFALHYYSWIVVQLYIKRTVGIAKYGREKFKELREAKNSIRAKDRYFLHKFVAEDIFKGAEIQHFWHEDMAPTYDYCAIWTREENQVIEKRFLEEKGWDVEGMVYSIEKVFLQGKIGNEKDN